MNPELQKAILELFDNELDANTSATETEKVDRLYCEVTLSSNASTQHLRLLSMSAQFEAYKALGKEIYKAKKHAMTARRNAATF